MRDFVDNLIGISFALFFMGVAVGGWVILIIAVLEYIGGE